MKGDSQQRGDRTQHIEIMWRADAGRRRFLVNGLIGSGEGRLGGSDDRAGHKGFDSLEGRSR